MYKNKIKSAFSLVELAVVFFVIAFLIVAILAGQGLVSSSKLAVARNLTANSPVNEMDNLVFWVEATSTESFDSKTPSENDSIGQWNDLSSTTNNATSSGSARPIYIGDAINGLPVLRFDGTDDYLAYDGTPIVNTGYTVMVVEQRRSNKSNHYFMGGQFTGTNQNLILGYENTSAISHAQFDNNYNVTIPSYTSPIPRIHAFTHNNATGKEHYLNGALSAKVAPPSDPLDPLTGYPGARIGQYYTVFFYDGDIGEVIIFNRTLSDLERKEVELYLSKKWGIKITY